MFTLGFGTKVNAITVKDEIIQAPQTDEPDWTDSNSCMGSWRIALLQKATIIWSDSKSPKQAGRQRYY